MSTSSSAPPYTSLRSVQLVLEEEYIPIALGAQNLFWEDEGAYTGEISGVFLKALHCQYVIIGHSERRKYFGETDETVEQAHRRRVPQRAHPDRVLSARRTRNARPVRPKPCSSGRSRDGLAGFTNDQIGSMVIAYEPVWAIGTGKAATPEDANETIGFARGVLATMTSDAIAQKVRIQYGGSVSAGNIAQLMAQPEIDGALVGGASLEAKSFAMIVRF